MDDVSRPEMGQLRERLFIEHGRWLPNLARFADNSSHGPRLRPASHGDERHRESSPGPVKTLFREFGVDWPLAGAAAKGQTDQGGTEFSDLAIFGFAVTAIMAVGHISGAAAHQRSVAPQTNFINVFWRVVSDLSAFQRGGSKPEVVVGGGSRCDGGVFSTGVTA